MARRRREIRKVRNPDPKFGDVLVSRFINSMLWSGKKAASSSIFYGALEDVEGRHNRPGLEIFREALDNVRPLVEVRSRRVGGATYQVPTEVRPTRQDALAIRWIVQSARERGEKSMRLRLAAELLDAAQNRGSAVKKKEEVHRMAEANRAFAHYRW